LQALPLSWERGLFLQPYSSSPLNREVERIKTHFFLEPVWESYQEEVKVVELRCIQGTRDVHGLTPRKQFLPQALENHPLWR